MWRRAVFLVWVGLLVASGQGAPVTDAQVDRTIQVLQGNLRSSQKNDGSWQFQQYPVGMTALAVQALLRSGISPKDPMITKGVHYIVNNTDGKVYSEALVPCALELLEDAQYDERIKQAVSLLVRAQTPSGGWSYTAGRATGFGDNSNAQFAALGLAAAERAGVRVPANVKNAAIAHWAKTQMRGGGWGYSPNSQETLSMTCAGLASLQQLGMTRGEQKTCCGPYLDSRTIQNGLNWLSRKLKEMRADDLARTGHGIYTLYAIERVGIFFGIKEFGDVDWYRWGAEAIVKRPPTGDSDRALALLFLARGSAPVAVAKWQWKGDWNNQRDDVKHWVESSSQDLGRHLDWLHAPLDSFGSPATKASLIFVNGKDVFDPTDKELDVLRAYLDLDGTLVAEPSCNSISFYDSFKTTIIDRLCPEYSPRFVPVEHDHPICSSFYQLTPEDVGALEFYAGCKQYRIILLTKPISCALNGTTDHQHDLPRAKKVATNLLAWAMQRKSAEFKLDEITLDPQTRSVDALTIDQIKRQAGQHGRQFRQPLGRVRHRGQWLAAPLFFAMMNQQLSQRRDLVNFDGEMYVAPTGGDLFQAAMLFMTGYEHPTMNDEEIVSLRAYLQNGGFLLATSACSSAEFDRGFREQMALVLPNDKLEVIPLTDPIYEAAYNLTTIKPKGTAAYVAAYKESWAPLVGVRREGRWVVVYSPVDFCTDIADKLHDRVPGYRKGSAFQLTANIIHYAFSP